MSLSPLYLDLTSDLHVSIAPNVHQGFPWLPSAQEKVAIFRVPASVLSFRSLSRKIRTEPCCIPHHMEMGLAGSLSLRALVCHHSTRTLGRLLGPCFKTGGYRPRGSWEEPDSVSRSVFLTAFATTSPEHSTPRKGLSCFWTKHYETRIRSTETESLGHAAFRKKPLKPEDNRAQPPSRQLKQWLTVSSFETKEALSRTRKTVTMTTMSGSVSLSFQSAFHLSFTLLVHYRSRWQY